MVTHLPRGFVVRVRVYDANTFNSRNSFEGYLSNTDIDAPKVSAVTSRTDPAHRASVNRLQRSRQRLGSQRHDLLVALRVINSVEREMVDAEWEGWLYGEAARCKQMEKLLGKDSTGSITSDDRSESGRQQPLGIEHLDWTEARSWHERYCSSCFRERESLVERQARMAG